MLSCFIDRGVKAAIIKSFFFFTQTKVTQNEKKLQHIKSSVDTLREEEKSVSGDSRRLKEQMKIVSKAQKDQEVPAGTRDHLALFFLNENMSSVTFSCSLFISEL